MRHPVVRVMIAANLAFALIAMGQEEPSGGQNGGQQQTPSQNMTPDQVIPAE